MTSYREIPLNDGRVAIVDAADFDWLSAWNWSASPSRGKPGTAYAIRCDWTGGKQRTVYMHRQIMRATSDVLIDHRNRCGLDNRRENLRECSYAQNSINRFCPGNRAGYRGVWIQHRKQRRFRASISVGGKNKHLGMFGTAREAAEAYDIAAFDIYGEFAVLNFPRPTDAQLDNVSRKAL